MERLRELPGESIADAASIDPTEGVLSLRSSRSANNDGATALDLVYQAAGIIQRTTERAYEVEARAKSIVEHAIDKLQAAESRHKAEISKQREMLNEAAAELAESERALEYLQMRIATAESQLSDAERQAKVAETRASEAQEALLRIEDAIRTQLLQGGRYAPRSLAAAA
jgi:chromosome segregation ATPase